MLADLYRQGLELRTTLTNNQTAEIVKELRTIHADFKEDAAFREQLQGQQFKFFGDGFLADIKKANGADNYLTEKLLANAFDASFTSMPNFCACFLDMAR
mgnify:CR=1 FL=1